MGVRLFLPWHRAYLHRLEQALQDQVEGVTTPWWDWRSATSRVEGIPKAFSDPAVGGQPNPLYKAHVSVPSVGIEKDTQRFPGEPAGLPPENTIERLVDNPQGLFSEWNDFNNELEEVHDQIHGWVGGYKRDANGWPLDENGNRIPDPLNNRDRWIYGDMGATTTAAFDPLFWTHHSMLDRIWWLWQQKHGNSGIPSNVLELVLEPFNLRVKDVLNIHDLGYEYAGAEVSVPGT